MSDREHETVREDPDILPTGKVFAVVLGVIAVTFVLCLVADFLLVLRERALRPGRRFPERLLAPPHVVAEVRQAPFEPSDERPSKRQDDEAQLLRWEWADRQRGLVQMPIDRAIDWALREGGDGGAK